MKRDLENSIANYNESVLTVHQASLDKAVPWFRASTGIPVRVTPLMSSGNYVLQKLLLPLTPQLLPAWTCNRTPESYWNTVFATRMKKRVMMNLLGCAEKWVLEKAKWSKNREMNPTRILFSSRLFGSACFHSALLKNFTVSLSPTNWSFLHVMKGLAYFRHDENSNSADGTSKYLFWIFLEYLSGARWPPRLNGYLSTLAWTEKRFPLWHFDYRVLVTG